MLYLDKARLETILGARGLSINKLAENCAISRQSIYNMFESTPVFNSSFEKIRQFLNVDYRAITSDKSIPYELLKNSPDRIKIATYKLFEFSKNSQADLLHFGSNDAGKFGLKHDWNFALYFSKKDREKDLSVLRQKLIDDVSPYAINIINLNAAPIWMKLIIKDNYVRLLGYTKEDALFASAD